MYCKNCGEQIDDKAEICVKCGVRVAPIPVQIQSKSPGLAALLSFVITGAGQVYNGEIGKGIALFSAAVISAILMFVAIGFILLPIVWIYGIYDAYKVAEDINSRKNQLSLTRLDIKDG